VQCARLLLCDHVASVPVRLGKQRMDGGYTVHVHEDPKWTNAPGRSVQPLPSALTASNPFLLLNSRGPQMDQRPREVSETPRPTPPPTRAQSRRG